MYNQRQNRLLIQAVEKLEQANALVQQALGESDATQFTCTAIQEIIEDLLSDIQENNPEEIG